MCVCVLWSCRYSQSGVLALVSHGAAAVARVKPDHHGSNSARRAQPTLSLAGAQRRRTPGSARVLGRLARLVRCGRIGWRTVVRGSGCAGAACCLSDFPSFCLRAVRNRCRGGRPLQVFALAQNTPSCRAMCLAVAHRALEGATKRERPALEACSTLKRPSGSHGPKRVPPPLIERASEFVRSTPALPLPSR